MPRTWVPPTMGERPDDRGLRGVERLADPGDAEDGADGHDRVRRRQDDQVGVGDRVDHARRRASSRRGRRRPRPRRAPRRAAGPSTPGSARPGGRSATRRRRSPRGSRPGRRSSAAADTPGLASAGTAPRSPRRAGSRRRASGCAPGGSPTSRSPRPNQVGSTPYAASSSLTLQVSSRRPQPRSGSMPSPSVYITVSRSGQTLSPCTHRSSAVLAMTVISASAATPGSAVGGDAVPEPLEELGAAHAAGEDGEPGLGLSMRRTLPGRVGDPSGGPGLAPIPDSGLTSGVRQACNSHSVVRYRHGLDGAGSRTRGRKGR